MALGRLRLDYPDASVGLVRLVDALGVKDQSLGREMLTQIAAGYLLRHATVRGLNEGV